jgi:hypothetical protein
MSVPNGGRKIAAAKLHHAKDSVHSFELRSSGSIRGFSAQQCCSAALSAAFAEKVGKRIMRSASEVKRGWVQLFAVDADTA